EAWDANHRSSHNHFMLGHITEWFYKDLVGIDCDPERPGFKNVVIKPTPVGDLQWAEASYDSLRGRIMCRWDRDGEQFKLRFVVPANSTATVYLPASPDSRDMESGVPVGESRGVEFVRREDGR